MLKLIDTYDIPEWAICYLVNGDAEGLAEEEIQEIDKFWHSLLDEHHASGIILDTEVMNEEKYGNYFSTEIDVFPAFGKQFGACKTWRIPVYVDIHGEKDTQVNIVIMGNNPLNNNKFEVSIFQNKKFCDMDEADTWANTYFDFLNNFEYYISKTEDSVINICDDEA